MGTAGKSVIDILVEDHREVEELFQELERPAAEPARRQEVLSAAIAELVRHSVAEEMYLYPAAREALPDGDQIADREIDDHSQAEQAMKRLERLQPDDPQFDAEVRVLTTSVREHITDEEENLFPRLREACSAEQLVELGGKIERAKRIAPTRPHPSAPSTPPGNMVLAPGAGLVDRVRDALSGRPTSPSDVQ